MRTTISGCGYDTWAAYLINGDSSGLEPDEVVAANQFADYMGGNIVSCGNESFIARPDYPPQLPQGTCCEYVALTE
jgi:hypothetical protein